MTIDELIEPIIKGKADFEQIGRDFFASGFDAEDSRKFLRLILEERNRPNLCRTVVAAYMNDKLLNLDFENFTGLSSLESRYFNIFISLVSFCGLKLRDIFPYLLYVLSSPDTSLTAKWKEAAESYLFKESARDFAEVFDCFTEFDLKIGHYDILLKADYSATVAALTERIINDKHADKAAIRMFFLKNKPPVVSLLIKKYADAKNFQKREIVKLLLVYKNEASAAHFLDKLENSDGTLPAILKIIETDKKNKVYVPKGIKKKDFGFCLKAAMINGTLLSADEFSEKVFSDPDNAVLAETTFFTVVKNGVISNVIVVDNGSFFDLDNRPFALQDDSLLGVLHPADIQSRFEFLRRLNIEQGFEQIKREVFVPMPSEKTTGVSARLSGRIIRLKKLISNSKKLGIKFINKEHSKDFRYAAVFMEGCVFVAEINKSEYPGSEELVCGGNARFYRTGELIKLKRQLYTKDVPLCPASEIPARVFSEIMFEINQLFADL